jgi:hypothetical protein
MGISNSTRMTASIHLPAIHLLVGLATLPLVFSLPESIRAGEETVIDGVLHVKNSSTPSQGLETLELEPLWSAGGEEDEEILFGVINQVLLDDENNIYLLDTQLSHVQVYSPTGDHLKTLGRKGSGPGEIRNPVDMSFMPDGTLGLVQSFPGKIIKLHPDGAPADTYIPETMDTVEGGFLLLSLCRQAGDNLVLGGSKMTMNPDTPIQERSFFLRSYGLDAKPRVEYLMTARKTDLRDFKHREIDQDFVENRMDVRPGGGIVVCEPRYDYALSVYSEDGTLERVIEREYSSLERNRLAVERVTRILEAEAEHMPPGTEVEAENEEMDVVDLVVRSDGTIWCQTSRAMWEPPEGVFTTYDVFSPEGHFVKQVVIACDGDPVRDRLIFSGDDLVFKITGYWDAVLNARGGGEEAPDAEPMAVTCYRIRSS